MNAGTTDDRSVHKQKAVGARSARQQISPCQGCLRSQLATLSYIHMYITLAKGMAIPLHTYGSEGGRGIAPTHSRPRHYMGMSGQRHAPATLYPRGKDPGTHYTGGWVGPKAGLDTRS
jgi:hypothetical protein